MKRIKYLSRHDKDLSPAEIADLAERAARKNESLDVTGIFMSSGQIFFQLIEGPVAHVDGLFEQIIGDPRHRDILLLDEEVDVEERFFPDWSMRKVDLDAAAYERLEPVRGMLEKVVEKRCEIDQLTRALEKAVWYELASVLED